MKSEDFIHDILYLSPSKEDGDLGIGEKLKVWDRNLKRLVCSVNWLFTPYFSIADKSQTRAWILVDKD